MNEHVPAGLATIVSAASLHWLLIVLGAVYWLVMIWATVRRDKREADKAEREK